MAKLPNYLCVFDLETNDKFSDSAFPVQIAFKMFDYYSLDPVPMGEFSTLACPPPGTILNPESMAIHKIPEADILKAPKIELAWENFVEEVQKYNKTKSRYMAPIVAGYNIRGFDLKIADRMNKLVYGDKPPVLFSDFRNIDLMDIVMMLFDTSGELNDNKFDTVRQYFGISSEGAHRADVDVKHEGFLLARLMKYMRQTTRTSTKKFKGAFKDFNWVNA